jgi:SAM-dependent methyltransferase
VAQDTHWEDVALAWPQTRPTRLLRAYSDATNRAWLEREVPAAAGTLLKTDAFDEAVGTGLVDFLRTRAEDVTVIDVSPSIVAAARQPGARYETGDVRSLRYPDESFDVVVSNSTLDHFQHAHEIEDALAELHRVLAPGGILLVSLDNPSNPLVALRNVLPYRPLARLGLVPNYVGATLDARRLRELLGRTGFDVERVEALMHVPRVLVAAIASLAGAAEDGKLVERLTSFERLGTAKTRLVTGQFVGARAVKR